MEVPLLRLYMVLLMLVGEMPAKQNQNYSEKVKRVIMHLEVMIPDLHET